tara:strand:+ start:7260 stop:8003 length:744 start_codon:yes stop_codon:yes gene_type:complete
MTNLLKRNFDFKKKTIIILGGSKGIGLEISKQLKLLNAKIIVISRTKPNLKINFIKCDFENLEEVKKIANQVKRKYKKNWAVINCLSITLPSNKKIQSPENFKKTININLINHYFFLSNIIKTIGNGGSILNISSIYGNLAFPNNPSYSSSKSALNGLTRSLAFDLSKRKIRVNSLSAGYIKSNMTKKSFNNKNKRKIISRHSLLGRWGSLSEIAIPAIFLISNASSFINGQDIVIDGGWTVKGFYK